MPPIQDSQYTDPMALRAKYRNPKSVIGNTEEASATAANVQQPDNIGTIQQTQPFSGVATLAERIESKNNPIELIRNDEGII
jgi:hypothetical protein